MRLRTLSIILCSDAWSATDLIDDPKLLLINLRGIGDENRGASYLIVNT